MSVPLLLGVLVVLLTAVGGFTNYKLPLYVFVIYTPFNYFVQGLRDPIPFVNPVNIFLIIIIITYSKSGRKRNVPIPLKGVIVFYISIIVIAHIHGGISYGIRHFKDNISTVIVWIIPMVVHFIVIKYLKEKKDYQKLALFFSFTLLIISLSVIKDFRQLGYDPDKRVEGILGQPNTTGAFLSLYPIIYLSLALQKEIPIWKRCYWGGVSVSSIIAMFYTFSRGAYVGFTVGLIAFAFMKDKRLLLIVVVGLVFYKAIIPKEATQRIEMTKAGSDGSGHVKLESSANSRFVIWDAAFKVFQSNILGTGVGGAPLEIYKIIGKDKDTHNYYMLILTEMGIPGIIAHLTFLIKLFFNCYRCYKNVRDDPYLKSLFLGILCSVFSVAFVNLTSSHFNSLEQMTVFWAFIGIVSSENMNIMANKRKILRNAAALKPKKMLGPSVVKNRNNLVRGLS